MGKIASGPGLKRPPKLCVVARWVAAELDDDDIAAIEGWFGDGFSVDDVHEHLGPPFSNSSLANHRARRCACAEIQPLQLLPADQVVAGG